MELKVQKIGVLNITEKDKKKLKHSDYLSLLSNKLTEVPAFITTLLTLKTLKINKNLLTEVPSTLYCLDNLRRLDLSENKITGISPGISSLKNLISLNLSYNELETVPEELKELKRLKFLYFKSNKLIRLNKYISELKELAFLDIRGNEIDSNDQQNELGHLSLRIFFGERLILMESDANGLDSWTIRLQRKLRARLLLLLLVTLLFWSGFYLLKIYKKEEPKEK